jgi:hypothetical protein
VLIAPRNASTPARTYRVESARRTALGHGRRPAGTPANRGFGPLMAPDHERGGARAGRHAPMATATDSPSSPYASCHGARVVDIGWWSRAPRG